MNKSLSTMLAGVVSLGFACFALAQSADLQPPKKREQLVEQGTQLAKTTPPEAITLPENIRNPFNPAAVEEVRTARPTSDKDLLMVLAEQIQPLGSIGVPGNMMMTRKGQKPVKVNDKLTLSFDGTSYEVEVTAIDNTTFSLRYNQTEITRPIKSGK